MSLGIILAVLLASGSLASRVGSTCEHPGFFPIATTAASADEFSEAVRRGDLDYGAALVNRGKVRNVEKAGRARVIGAAWRWAAIQVRVIGGAAAGVEGWTHAGFCRCVRTGATYATSRSAAAAGP